MEAQIDEQKVVNKTEIEPKKFEIKPETLEKATVNVGPYLMNAIYGVMENNKVLVQDCSGFFGTDGNLGRATSGLRGMIDNNIGDGIFVGINTLAADALLGVVDGVSRKVGGKGIKPEVRFLSALTIGVAMTTYMESRKDFLIGIPNTPDFVWGGDLFGIALGAASMLAGRIVAEKIANPEKFEESLKKKTDSLKAAAKKFESFCGRLSSLKRVERRDDPLVEQSSKELAQLIVNE